MVKQLAQHVTFNDASSDYCMPKFMGFLEPQEIPVNKPLLFTPLSMSLQNLEAILKVVYLHFTHA